MTEKLISPDSVFSKPFNGTTKLYRKISLIAAIYTSMSIYSLYAMTRYFWLEDESVFNWTTLIWVPLFGFCYFWFCYRKMQQYDGIGQSGKEWVAKIAQVKLIEQEVHKRFG